MKKLNTLLLLLTFFNVNAQINLNIAEAYIKGDSTSLFNHLTEERYSITKDTIWLSNATIDSVYEYTNEQGTDRINIIKNKGFIITPIVSDSINYYTKYLEQLLVYLTNNEEQIELVENLDNGAMKMITKEGIVYIVDPNQPLIMIH